MKRCRPALGTFVEISLADPRAAAIEPAFAAIEQVEAAMSFHRASSDLARLNRSRAGELIEVDWRTAEVLALALDLNDATDGLFDCAVGAELIASGLLPGEAPAAGSGSVRDVEVVDRTHLRLRRAVCLDLGGIAKGYAVDQAVEALARCGVTQATVNAGGDLRVLGPAPQQIHVRSATDPGRALPVGQLADGAIATSSTCFSGGWHAGRWRSALIDTRTRAPFAGRRSYSVLASRCAVADALTKPLAIAGALSADCLRRYGATSLVL